MMRAAITRDPIDVPALLAEVTSEGCGALSLFVGTVRDSNDGRAVTGIEYTAYEPMAVREMHAILDEAARAHEVERLALVHRLGALALGEASVAIVAAHAHRAPALDATRFVIEELKRRVPIWKREHYIDGTREWVDPAGAHAASEVP
jgi:molybdopterin synthase catalytic subunit